MDLAEFFTHFGLTLLTLMGIALVLALLLLLIVWRQVKRVNVPPNATFGETLLLTPFLVVVLIDLLDFALDFLAAPIAWIILDRLGAKSITRRVCGGNAYSAYPGYPHDDAGLDLGAPLPRHDSVTSEPNFVMLNVVKHP